MQRSEIEERLILAGVVGSTGYGLARPESDIDVKGICVGGKETYLGYKTFEVKDSGWDTEPGKYEFLNGKDTSIYELRKILTLMVGNNPNASELLWLGDYLHITPIGQRLVAERSNLLSKKAKHTYSGYSYSQIKRVETHRKWLLDPPTSPPKMEDYGFDEEYKPLTKSETNAFLEFLYICVRDCIEYLQPCEDLRKLLLQDLDYKGIFQQHLLPKEVDRTVMQYTRCSKDFLHLLHQTQTYRVALRHWESYQSWKKNRNSERAAMERKIGYDAKHMCHAIRLLETGHEILRDQVIIVDRRKTSTHKDLMEIRNGDWEYDRALARAEELRAILDKTYEASTLKHAVDNEYVNKLCVELVEEYGW